MIVSASISLPFVIVVIDTSLLPSDAQLEVLILSPSSSEAAVVSRAVVPTAASATGEKRSAKAVCVTLWCPESAGRYTVSLRLLAGEKTTDDVISETELTVYEWTDRRICSFINLYAPSAQCGGEIIITGYNSNECSGGSWIVCPSDSLALGSAPAPHGWFTPPGHNAGYCRVSNYTALEHAPQFSLPAPIIPGQYEVRYIKTVGDATSVPTVVARSAPFEVELNDSIVERSATGSILIMEDQTETDTVGQVAPKQRLFVYVDLSAINPVEVTSEDLIQFVPVGMNKHVPVHAATLQSGVLRGAFAVSAPSAHGRYEMQYVSAYTHSALASVFVDVKEVAWKLFLSRANTVQICPSPAASILCMCAAIEVEDQYGFPLELSCSHLVAEDAKRNILGTFALRKASVSDDDLSADYFIDDVAIAHLSAQGLHQFVIHDRQIGQVLATCAAGLDDTCSALCSSVPKLPTPRCRFGSFSPDELSPAFAERRFYMSVETSGLASDGPRIVFAVGDENEPSVALSPYSSSVVGASPLVWTGGTQFFHVLPRQAATSPVIFLDFDRALLRASTVLRTYLINQSDVMQLDERKIFLDAPSATPFVLESPLRKKVRALIVDTTSGVGSAEKTSEQLKQFLRNNWEPVELVALTGSNKTCKAPSHGVILDSLSRMLAACADDETVFVLLMGNGEFLSLPPSGVACDEVDGTVTKHFFPSDYDVRFATITPSDIAALVAASHCRGEVIIAADLTVGRSANRSTNVGGETSVTSLNTDESLSLVNCRVMKDAGYEICIPDEGASNEDSTKSKPKKQLIWIERVRLAALEARKAANGDNFITALLAVLSRALDPHSWSDVCTMLQMHTSRDRYPITSWERSIE